MIYPRPKLTIFAEAAKTGEVIAYPDWARGWGITLEQTNSKPPMEWMNDALKQLNTHSLYLLQNGGYEWDKTLEYPVGAKVQLNNLIYIAKEKNTNINPVGNINTWQVYGLQQSDISQLLDGTNKTKVASEDALRRVNLTAEKGVSDAKVAKEKADLVGVQANQNTQNLDNKVSKSGDTMTDHLFIVRQNYPSVRCELSGYNSDAVGGSFYMENESGIGQLVSSTRGGRVTGRVAVPNNISGHMQFAEDSLFNKKSWKNVMPSRSSGVTYINTDRSPRCVSVGASGRDPNVEIRVSGVLVASSRDTYDSPNARTSAFAIVPSGANYVVTLSATHTLVNTFWSEA